MSCDWDVYCKDCDSSHGFDDANHEDKLMHELAKLGPQLKRLCIEMIPIVALTKDRNLGLFVTPAIVLNPGTSHELSLYEVWWAKHGDHKLVARDEYGRCDDECAESFFCKECNRSMWCVLSKNHDGPHDSHRKKAA